MIPKGNTIQKRTKCLICKYDIDDKRFIIVVLLQKVNKEFTQVTTNRNILNEINFFSKNMMRWQTKKTKILLFANYKKQKNKDFIFYKL